MIKFILLILFFMLNLNAKEMNFKEFKFISAFDTEIEKSGLINFQNDFIELNYFNEDKKYFFYNDKLILKEKKSEEILPYEEHIEFEIFYKLLYAIYTDNFKLLEEYFNIKKEKNITYLEANEIISNVISNVEFKKSNDLLSFLNIYFSNDDRIKIVQTK